MRVVRRVIRKPDRCPRRSRMSPTVASSALSGAVQTRVTSVSKGFSEHSSRCFFISASCLGCWGPRDTFRNIIRAIRLSHAAQVVQGLETLSLWGDSFNGKPLAPDYHSAVCVCSNLLKIYPLLVTVSPSSTTKHDYIVMTVLSLPQAKFRFNSSRTLIGKDRIFDTISFRGLLYFELSLSM